MPTQQAQIMNQLIRGNAGETVPGIAKATEIRQLYKTGLQQIRGDRHMHPDRKRVELATLYTSAKETLAKVRMEQTERDAKTFDELDRKVWGYALERATATDRATLDTTIRDARDRAAKLKTAEHAGRALRDAELAGDHILARAIGKQAHDHDWNDVLYDYFENRPSAAAAYQQAGEIWHRTQTAGGRVHEGMQYVVPKPEELRGLNDQDINGMTGDPNGAAA
ncbi:hypothetical protein ACIO3O_19650 [Streptomyces sp. NPDC087440]|uniref:hypothetical protein n=1 Tax=Streptomyces sp. NPDC087440 TaxID=3365790 RepID=UPI0037F45DB3